MTNEIFGYIRVSSKDQNEARQIKDMLELNIPSNNILMDKESGKNFDRPQYKDLKKRLRKGDLLYIKSIDRFGRNSKEIKKEWEEITQNIKADIIVLDMPLLDTTQYKDTLGTFVSELVLQVLAFVSERERENILSRQKEGIEIAKAKGKHLGRPQLNLNTMSKHQLDLIEAYYPKWKAKEITGVEFMKQLNLKKNTFYKIIAEYETK